MINDAGAVRFDRNTSLSQKQQMEARKNLNLYGTFGGIIDLLTMVTVGNGEQVQFIAPLTAGNEYTVTCDGVNYNCVCAEEYYTASPFVGNQNIFSSSQPDTGEPFFLLADYSNNLVVTASFKDDAEHSISVSGFAETKEKVPEDYLPPIVGRPGTGQYSEVFNFNPSEPNIASDTYSHAEGMGTQATNQCSHAEGNLTTASGICAHAEGANNTASGYCSHAEGNGNTASGEESHAEGTGTVASGDGSHAEGMFTQANGQASHASGRATVANGENQFVIGRQNIPDNEGKYAFIIGHGDVLGDKNIFTVDWEGNVECFGLKLNRLFLNGYEITVDASTGELIATKA